MTKAGGSAADWGTIDAWFAERGFALAVDRSETDDVVWVDLLKLPSRRVVAPRYVHGMTALEAAQRAKARFSEEQ